MNNFEGREGCKTPHKVAASKSLLFKCRNISIQLVLFSGYLNNVRLVFTLLLAPPPTPEKNIHLCSRWMLPSVHQWVTNWARLGFDAQRLGCSGYLTSGIPEKRSLLWQGRVAMRAVKVNKSSYVVGQETEGMDLKTLQSSQQIRIGTQSTFLTGLPVPVPRSAPARSSPVIGGRCRSSPAPRCRSLPPPAGSPADCGSLLWAPPARRSPAECCTESPPPTTWLQFWGSCSHSNWPGNSTKRKYISIVEEVIMVAVVVVVRRSRSRQYKLVVCVEIDQWQQ